MSIWRKLTNSLLIAAQLFSVVIITPVCRSFSADFYCRPGWYESMRATEDFR